MPTIPTPRRKILILYVLPLTALVGVLHQGAIHYYWYWLFWWMDVLMHFLGGAWVALASLWVVFYSGIVNNREEVGTTTLFATMVGTTIMVGVGWEIFEYLSGMFLDGNLFPDTWQDLVADTIGALIVFGIVYYVRRRHTTS